MGQNVNSVEKGTIVEACDSTVGKINIENEHNSCA